MRNAAHLLFGQVATTVLTIVLNSLMGRYLGPSNYGLYVLVNSFTTFGYVFVEMGQTNYGIREIARHPEKSGELMGSALALRVIAAVVSTGFAVGITWLLGYDGHTRSLTAIMMAAWLPMLLAQGFSIVFRGRERMDLDAIVNVVLKMLMLGISMAALLLGGRLLALVLVPAAAGSLSLLMAVFLYRKLEIGPLRATRPMARAVVVGSIPLVTMNLVIGVQQNIDTVLLSKLTSNVVVGWYGAAWLFAGTLLAPAGILGSAAYPRFSRAADDLPEFKRVVQLVFRPLLFIALLGGVGTYLFADFAVGIVYKKETFGPAADTLRAFSPALMLMFVDMLLGNAILAVNKTKQLAAAKFIAVVVTAGSEFFLISVFQRHTGNGGVGAMLAQSVGEVVMIVAACILIPRGTLDRTTLLDVGRGILATAGTLGIFFALPHVSPFIGIPLCVAVFVALSALVGFLGRADLEAMMMMLRGRKDGAAA
jgi:PST family polysaccharide transporter